MPLKPKPVNNTRADKLETFFWRYSFEERRCLIPLEAFAEAEGQRGQMTRTWITLPDRDLFAVAGIWRESEQWGRCSTRSAGGALLVSAADISFSMLSSHTLMSLRGSGTAPWRCVHWDSSCGTHSALAGVAAARLRSHPDWRETPTPEAFPVPQQPSD